MSNGESRKLAQSIRASELQNSFGAFGRAGRARGARYGIASPDVSRRLAVARLHVYSAGCWISPFNGDGSAG